MATVRKFSWLVGVAVIVLGLDQWTKFLVLERFTSAFHDSTRVEATVSGQPQPTRLAVFLGQAPPPSWDGLHYRPASQWVLSASFFRLRYAENPGAAFGLFRALPENVRGPLFHVVSLGAVLLISFYFSRLTGSRDERFARWGLPLVLGGALGNAVDRVARGFVIDFIEAHWYERIAWPAFNIADTAICVGVALLVVDSFVRRDPAEQRVAA
jgi:signal peptidase II